MDGEVLERTRRRDPPSSPLGVSEGRGEGEGMFCKLTWLFDFGVVDFAIGTAKLGGE